MVIKIFKEVFPLLIVTLILMMPVLGVRPCRSTPACPSFQKGMSYVVWADDKLSYKKVEDDIKAMAAAGVDSVAVVVSWFQDAYHSHSIRSIDRSPSDASVLHIIKAAHLVGMSVLLKPQVDLVETDGDTSRRDIGFQSENDWQSWSKSYVRFITHYAELAESTSVEIFCVGNDLTFAASNTKMWKNLIIPEVRKVFSGYVTYAARWDDYRSVEFWSELDYAGINAYFPLAKGDNPTFQEIVEGWRRWAAEIEEWHTKVKKPVIFTECGYPSVDSAAKRPWEEPVGGRSNTEAQAACYRALFKTLWEKQWFYGVYWWNWNTYPASDGDSLATFTPQNKPALLELKQWYSMPIAYKISAAPVAVGFSGIKWDDQIWAEVFKKKLSTVSKSVGLEFEGEALDKWIGRAGKE